MSAFAPLIADRRATLICLDSVVECFGSRWSARREHVLQHVERTICRYIGPQGLVFRLSDTEIVIGQPDVEPMSAQASSLRCLREILTHFLGDSHLANQGVFEVVRLADGELHVHPVDPVRAEAGELAASRAGGKPGPEVLSRSGPWVRTFCADEREVEVRCVAQAFLELRRVHQIGFRLVRSAQILETGETLTGDRLAQLGPADRLAIERISFELALEALSGLAKNGPLPVCVLPLSYATLTTSRARALALGFLRDAAAFSRGGVVCELEDLAGVPQVTLVSALSSIKLAARAVAAAATDVPATKLPMFRTLGFNALSAEPRGSTRQELPQSLSSFVAAAKQARSPAWVHGLTSISDVVLAAQLGATHASLAMTVDQAPVAHDSVWLAA